MKRSRSSTARDDNVDSLWRQGMEEAAPRHQLSSSPVFLYDAREEHHEPEQESGEAIVRNIASFLTLSDAASLTPGVRLIETNNSNTTPLGNNQDVTPADSWAVGVELDPTEASWGIATPLTPALVAVSPGATPANENDDEYDDDDESSWMMQQILRDRTRRWALEKLTKAIFAHPGSLRSFCLDAYAAAQDIREQQERQRELAEESNPETRVYPNKRISRKQQRQQEDPRFLIQQALHDSVDLIFFHNVPLSVVFDLLQASGELSLDTSWASLCLTNTTIHAIPSAVAGAVGTLYESVTQFHPGHWLEAIISMQFNAMERTSGVLATGLHSVATSVGSASNMALHRFSAANLSSATSRPTCSSATASMGSHGLVASSAQQKVLLRKLSTINDAARVVAYEEYQDNTGGLTQHAISRTRRMMHYSVSLRPFVATVAVPPKQEEQQQKEPTVDVAVAEVRPVTPPGNDDESPFMCTPQSFPPTPHSRQMVMMQKSRKSNDVIFSARDRLRLADALNSEDERTREMANALFESKLLAVFHKPKDGNDNDNDIELSCGHHIATKLGSTYYSTVRSEVALWRNSYCYFEITVLPHVGSAPPIAMPTLSIGLSTGETPPNTLVGAWQGSVGLHTTGQILLAGQWCTPQGEEPCGYTAGATVGCLVCLDDDTAFETWDGVMITARVTFSVNGQVVPSSFPVHPSLSSSATTTTSSSCQEDSSGSFSSSPSPPPPNNSSRPTVNLLVPSAEDVFPTVTLQSAATAVMCRFSSGDIIASSRERIGAPSGDVPIYAVDGSILAL